MCRSSWRTRSSVLCKRSPVKAAYVARQRRTRSPDAPSEEVLAIALELTRPPTSAGERRTRKVIHAVLAELPKMGGAKGVSVLADAALLVWREKAVRVFERHP